MKQSCSLSSTSSSVISGMSDANDHTLVNLSPAVTKGEVTLHLPLCFFYHRRVNIIEQVECGVHYRLHVHGSYGSLKTWKVMEFDNLDSRPGKS